MTPISTRHTLVLFFIGTLQTLEVLAQDHHFGLKDSGTQYVARFDNQSICFTYFKTIAVTRGIDSSVFSGNPAEDQNIFPLLGGDELSEVFPGTSGPPPPLSNPVGILGDSTNPPHAGGIPAFTTASTFVSGGFSSYQPIQNRPPPINTFLSPPVMLPPGMPSRTGEQSDTGGPLPNSALTSTDAATIPNPTTVSKEGPNGSRSGTLSTVGGTDDSLSPALVAPAGDSSTAKGSPENSLNPFFAGDPQTPDAIPVSGSNSNKLSTSSVTKSAALGTTRTTSLRRTSLPAESRIILSVRQDSTTPAADTVTVTNGLQSTTTSAVLKKRQDQPDNSTTGFVGDEDVPVPNSCSNARVFRRGRGTLQKQGVARPLSVDPGVPFIDLANYSGGSIITNFDVIDDTLVWSSAFFFQGKAGFCQVEGGSVYATFTPAGGPENCHNVSLVAYKGTLCLI